MRLNKIHLFEAGMIGVLISLGALGWQTRYPATVGIVIIAIFSLWIFRVIFLRQYKPTPLPWPLWLVLAGAFLSALFSTYLYQSLVEFSFLLALLCLFWLVFDCRSFSKHLINHVIIALIVISSLVAVYGIIDFFSLQDASFGIASTFGWRNTYGGFLALATPFVVLQALSIQRKKQTVVLFFVSLLLIVNLILTFSQASWLTSFIAFVAAILFMRNLWSKIFFIKISVLLLFSLIIVKGLFFLHPLLAITNPLKPNIQDAASLHGLSIQNRFDYWSSGLSMGLDHPLTGVGLGNFGDAYPQYQKNIWSHTVDPHQWLIKLFAEGGIAALFPMLIFIVWIVQKSWTAPDRFQSPRIALAAGLASSFFHSLLDYDYRVFAILGLVAVFIAMLLPLPTKTSSKYFSKPLAFFLYLVASLGIFSIAYSELLIKQAENAFNNFDIQQSIHLAKRASILSPLNSQPGRWLSDGYMQKLFGLPKGDEKEELRSLAMAYGKKSLALQSQFAPRYNQIAVLYEITYSPFDPEFQTVIKNYQQSLLLDSWNRPETYIKLAIALNRQKNIEESRAVLNRFLSLFGEKQAISKAFYPPGRLREIEIMVKTANEMLADFDAQTR